MKYKLGECIEEIVDKTTKNNQYEVLSVTKDGIYSQEEFFKKQIASEDNTGYKIIRKNNLVFSTMNLWMGSLDVLSNYEIGIVSPAYKIFKFDESKMIPSFGKYFMKSHFMLEQYKDCSEQGASVVRRNLDLKQLLDTEIIIPKVEEQCKIVKILENIDEIINKYTNLIRNKDQFIKSQFVEMFGNPNENNKGLEIVKLKNICENLDNKRIPVTSTNRTSGKYPYYGASGIVDYVNDYIFDEDLLLVSEDGANLIARVTPIAFSITGKAWVNNHAHVLRFKNKCTQIYVENFFENLNINQYITGITQPKLNQERLNSIEIPIPDIESQEKYMGIKKLIDKQKFELEKQKQNYIDLKKGLMQQLLTGKLKV